jgi:hypothetical protein
MALAKELGPAGAPSARILTLPNPKITLSPLTGLGRPPVQVVLFCELRA